MTKRGGKKGGEDTPRVNGVRRAGDLVAPIAGVAFKRFGFIQGAVVERWPEIVGEHYARHSLPESIRFPSGKKRGGTLTLLVEGAQAPLFQHLAPMIMEKLNDFFGAGAVTKVVFRQGRLPARRPSPQRPRPAPVPEELGEGLREIADPELRSVLESLASGLEGAKTVPNIPLVGRIGEKKPS
ncbi:DUF721 domain-containing protein [Sphingomicrobium astaxanthinifaciens]|uniref:DUF721 domain-containing protein n=1 Tax=Sphingomicrobium astaxanthinifaciens TaxID=1227949 RepID=UPI001FCB1944|nr:DUF721 domain-containing protein [Sphingomicrobium astaxanthinifaciens]MCJ7421514.1 DUF721 domain-containing protein [Sphingomicrobium astaxanthinifaciens]